MQRPHLIIVAGCNGAGKLTYSSSIVENVVPFDYDKRFIEIYQSMQDSELREQFALDKTTSEINHLVETAFVTDTSFCFETNLHDYPETWIKKAKDLNYIIDMYFFCLENIEMAKDRVAIRAKNKGHFVPENVINYKWKEGYKNVNHHFSDFDYIAFIDNSEELIPKILFEMNKVAIEEFAIYVFVNKLPAYIPIRFPDIFKLYHK